ncbi:MAG: hypothetical protein NW206_14405 [Hyphomonadaceae bacterium]|nr:hypothetical protein [Hyphomonadaceae bacterium]
MSVSALAFSTRASDARGDTASLVREGKLGFIVSSIRYALADDPVASGACPAGMSANFLETYARQPGAQRRAEESERDFERRSFTEAMTGPGGENLCINPGLAPDPYFRELTSRTLVSAGIDLDGRASRASGVASGSQCAHDDFPGEQGRRGVDNQYLRVVGCIRGYQPGGLAHDFESEMLTGAWSIVIALSDVEDLRRDDDVTVGIHAGADPIQLSASGQALPFATYAIDADPRFQAVTRGRIRDGVLTTEPVDVRFHFSAAGQRFERSLRHARLEFTIHEDGAGDGYLSGYAPIEDVYRNQVGFNGNTFVAGAAANALGYTCNGIYAALQRMADGDRDPQTGRCSSISTQYRIRAAPAFVLEANNALEQP